MGVVEEVVLWPLVALPSAQEGPVVEHVYGRRVQGPIVPLPWVTRFSGHLHEAVVEGEVVPDRVLPGRELVFIVRKPSHNKVTNLTECHTFLGGLHHSHGDESDIGVGRLDMGGCLVIYTSPIFDFLMTLQR